MASPFQATDLSYPGGVADSWESWSDHCDKMWQMYSNTAYRDLARWQRYLWKGNYYRNTRSIVNPTNRVVEFYATMIYPGWLTIDPDNLDPGVANAMPIRNPAREELLPALSQGWQWSNWQAKKSVLPRYGSMTGSVMLEVHDEPGRKKVTIAVLWPGHVRDVILDSAGNVKAYQVEYDASDESGAYRYKKTVDQEAVRYFRDNRPWTREDTPSVQRNLYGFVPAAWVRHIDVGSVFGMAAIEPSLTKIEELNSFLSHTLDHGHKTIASPMVLAGANGFGNSPDQIASARRRRALGAPDTTPSNALMQNVPLLFAPAGTTLLHLTGNMSIPDAVALVHEQMSDIRDDLPEITAHKELRAMSQVTGPAAARLLGEVTGKLSETQANYDTQSRKAFQMMLAIAGWRISRGDWGRELTAQQRVFEPFDLVSYEKGELDFDIAPRPLIALTPEEQINRTRQQLSLAGDQAEADAVSAFSEATRTPPTTEE